MLSSQPEEGCGVRALFGRCLGFGVDVFAGLLKSCRSAATSRRMTLRHHVASCTEFRLESLARYMMGGDFVKAEYSAHGSKEKRSKEGIYGATSKVQFDRYGT